MFDNLVLRGITLEGEPTGITERPCTFDDFKDILNHSRKAWDDGLISKYFIFVFDGENVVDYFRPDKWNFDLNGQETGYYVFRHAWENSIVESINDDDPVWKELISSKTALYLRLVEQQGSTFIESERNSNG